MNERQTKAKSRTLDPETWVDQHGDYLYRYVLSRIQDHSVAEDLGQEKLLAALQSNEPFKGRSAEKTWLTGIRSTRTRRRMPSPLRIRKSRAESYDL